MRVKARQWVRSSHDAWSCGRSIVTVTLRSGFLGIRWVDNQIDALPSRGVDGEGQPRPAADRTESHEALANVFR